MMRPILCGVLLACAVGFGLPAAAQAPTTLTPLILDGQTSLTVEASAALELGPALSAPAPERRPTAAEALQRLAALGTDRDTVFENAAEAGLQ